jgi:hypothetical protein
VDTKPGNDLLKHRGHRGGIHMSKRSQEEKENMHPGEDMRRKQKDKKILLVLVIILLIFFLFSVIECFKLTHLNW